MDTRQNERELALEQALNGKIGEILTVRGDAKTIKGEKYGVVTGIVYLAPGATSGYELCKSRTVGCTASCLFSAGHGRYPNVRVGRLRKTYLFIHRKEEFMQALHTQIRQLAKMGERLELSPAVRLNGTSDIPWHKIPFVTEEGEWFENIFVANQDLQFYDYTKRFNRLVECKDIPNYSLTFSRAETKLSHTQAMKALEMGFDVSVVFDKVPDQWMGYRVIDGDLNDVRFWKQPDGPVIVGLKAKGEARYDTTGFVVRTKK